MSSIDGITVSAPDMFELRRKLGFRMPDIGIDIGDAVIDPKITIKSEHGTQTFFTRKAAINYVVRLMLKRLEKWDRPKNRGGKKRSLRTKSKRSPRTSVHLR